MDGLNIKKISDSDGLYQISLLAEKIWREHFTPILPPGQVDYMLDKFQSHAAMLDAVQNDGYSYYAMDFGGCPVGYFAVKPDGKRLFLSKLYVEKGYRGRGFSTAALKYIEAYCREKGFGTIWLTVNRHNDNTISVYEHFGFKVFKECATDIGGGYVMDDYFMELQL